MHCIHTGNLTTLPFSNLNNLEELSGPNSDYTPNIASQLPDPNHWKAFRHKGLHFLHLNVNSLQPKIDEVKLIADRSNATIIGISETKLDITIINNELECYDLVLSNRNRHGGGVSCYIKRERHYNVRSNCPSNFENIFLDLYCQIKIGHQCILKGDDFHFFSRENSYFLHLISGSVSYFFWNCPES